MPYKNKDIQRKYQSEWVRKRRQEWLAANGPCVRCSSPEDLEIDHIDPSTKLSHSIWTWTETKRTAELQKCQVLCRKCHMQKSFENSESGFKLKPDQIPLILKYYADGAKSVRQVATAFGISKTAAWRICTKQSHQTVIVPIV